MLFLIKIYTISFPEMTRHVFILVVRHLKIITAKYTIIFILISLHGLGFFLLLKVGAFSDIAKVYNENCVMGA